MKPMGRRRSQQHQPSEERPTVEERTFPRSCKCGKCHCWIQHKTDEIGRSWYRCDCAEAVWRTIPRNFPAPPLPVSTARGPYNTDESTKRKRGRPRKGEELNKRVSPRADDDILGERRSA